jgi:aminoglycoside 6-adenylyltransferase
MLFRDGNRIDLTLFPHDKLVSGLPRDSLNVLLLDKDRLFPNLPGPRDRDLWIKRPVEKEFTDCCNEFWWVCTYVVKGLVRNEIIYAKEMLEVTVRSIFLKVIYWHVGLENDFSISVGRCGKYLENYVSPVLYKKILLTYPDHRPEKIWNSLFMMTELFGDLANTISIRLHFAYNKEEEIKVKECLKKLYAGAFPQNDQLQN